MGVELDLRAVVEHLLDPDHARAQALGGRDGLLHFRRDLGRVRSAGAQNDLKSRIQVLDGVDQMDDPLLPRDSTDEKNVGLVGVDAEPAQRAVGLDRVVFVGVDPVVDDVDFFRVHLEEPFDVAPGFVGNGDDGIRQLQRGFF